LKMGRASPDNVCSVKRWFGCLSDNPATVTKHGLSSTQPCAIRLRSDLTVKTITARWWGLNAYAGIPLTAGNRSFSDGWPTLLSASLFLGPHSNLLAGSRVALGVFQLLSGAGRFPPPSHTGSYPTSGLAPQSSITPIDFCLFDRLGAGGSPRMS
jgi:hypothetical protein